MLGCWQMPKYFFMPTTANPSTITLEGEVAHHLIRVLRANVGDRLVLCDGNNTDYLTQVAEITKTQLSCHVLSTQPSGTEPRTKVTIFQAMPKSDKLELIIQKSVELGAAAIVPVITSRTVMRKWDDKKTSRYQKIAEAAAGQSMRGTIPIVHTGMFFKEMLTNVANCYPTLVAYEQETAQTLASAVQTLASTSVNIFIGPEGGLAPEEVEALKEIGATTVSLGPRILRTETAAIAMLAQLMCLLET